MTSKEKALEGVRSGEYYAAIVFPKEFSANMMTVLSKNVKHAKVIYAVNEKKNAIGTIVTDKVSTAAQNAIDSNFDSALTQVLAGVLTDLSDTMTDQETLNLVSRLDGMLGDGATELRNVATNVDSYKSLVSSTSGLLASSNGMLSSATDSGTGAGALLRKTSSGVRKLDGAVDGVTDSLNSTLQKSSDSFDNVSSAIDAAYATAGGSTTKLKAALLNVKSEVDTRRSNLQDLSNQLNGTDTLAKSWETKLGQDGDPATLESVSTVRLTIEGLNNRVTTALSDLTDLSTALQKTADDIDRASSDADSTKSQLQTLVTRAKSSLSGISDEYEQGLRGSLGTLANTIDGAASDADALASKFASTTSDLDKSMSSTQKSLSGV